MVYTDGMLVIFEILCCDAVLSKAYDLIWLFYLKRILIYNPDVQWQMKKVGKITQLLL